MAKVMPLNGMKIASNFPIVQKHCSESDTLYFKVSQISESSIVGIMGIATPRGWTIPEIYKDDEARRDV